MSKQRSRRFVPVLVVMALGLGNTGCGIIGWAISPKAEVVHYTVPRLEEVQVRSMPEGAVVLVDGAEAGRTPRSVKVAVSEVRAQRRQGVVLGVVGLILDVAVFGAVTALAINENAPEATLISAGTGLVVATLGGYLNFGRNTTNDSTDVLPTAVELGIQYPGYQEQRRRIRVPDLQQVDFLLQPEAPKPPAPADAPRQEPPPSPENVPTP